MTHLRVYDDGHDVWNFFDHTLSSLFQSFVLWLLCLVPVLVTNAIKMVMLTDAVCLSPRLIRNSVMGVVVIGKVQRK